MYRLGAPLSLLVVVAGLLLIRESRLDPLRAVDETFADFQASQGQRTAAPAAVTLIEIRADALAKRPLPWGPLDFALYFQSANAFTPEVVATDELLTWDHVSGADLVKAAQYSRLLREHVLQSPKALLGARLGYPKDPDQLPPMESLPVLRHVKGDPTLITDFSAIDVWPAEDFRLSSALGFINVPELRSVQNGVPLLLRYRGQIIPSFVLQAAMLWEKALPDDLKVDLLAGDIQVSPTLRIPIDSRGWMRVDFGVPYDRCSFMDLVLANAEADAKIAHADAAGRFTGKFLMLSRADDAADRLQLAANRKGTRGELFCAGLATIQNRAFIRPAPLWVEWIMVGVCMVLAFFVQCLSRFVAISVALITAVGYTLAAILSFHSHFWTFPAVLPGSLLLIILAFRFVTPRWTSTTRK